MSSNVFRGLALTLVALAAMHFWELPGYAAPSTQVITSPSTPDGQSGWFVTVPSLTLDATPDGAAMYFSWDSTADIDFVAYTGTVTPDEGAHVLRYFSVAAGETEDVQTADVMVDTVPPVNPSDVNTLESYDSFNGYIRSLPLTTYWSLWGGRYGDDASSGVAGWSYSFTKGVTQEADVTMDLEFPPSYDPEAGISEVTASMAQPITTGTHYFNIRAIDVAGNRAASTGHLGPMAVDIDSPTVAYGAAALKEGAYVKGKILIPGTASDVGSGVAWVNINQDLRWWKQDPVSPFRLEVDTSSFNNGLQPFELCAGDNASNEHCAAIRKYRVDNYRPRTRAPYSASVKKGGWTKLYYKVSDKYTDKAGVTIVIKNSRGQFIGNLYAGWKTPGKLRYKWYEADLPRGTYYFYVKAKDHAGNTQYNKASDKLIVR